MTQRRNSSLPVALAVGLATLPGISHAMLEEVIVTAQKREQNVQSILLVDNAGEYWVHAFDSSFGFDLGASAIQGEPRMWGVSGRYSW